MSNVYDRKINAVINIASRTNKPYTGIEEGNVNRCSMSMVTYEDDMDFDCLNKRRNDSWIRNGNYFKKAKKSLMPKLKRRGFI